MIVILTKYMFRPKSDRMSADSGGMMVTCFSWYFCLSDGGERGNED